MTSDTAIDAATDALAAGDRRLAAWHYEYAARLLHGEGDPEAAAIHLLLAARYWEEPDDRADALMREAGEIFQRRGNAAKHLETIVSRATRAAQDGRRGDAVELFAAGATLAEQRLDASTDRHGTTATGVLDTPGRQELAAHLTYCRDRLEGLTRSPMSIEINRYVLAELSAERRAALLKRAQGDFDSVRDVTRDIVEDVRVRGDEALAEYTAKFDGAQVPSDALLVTRAEFDAAEALVPPTLRAAIEQAVENIRAHHAAQLPPASWMAERTPGVISGERVLPIASAALYVPRGKGSFPSVMMMLSIPAVLAGVPRVVACTPPGPDGSVDAATLLAARLCGVETVYKMGGAQAVAALAYGTEAVERVDKIVGPGNQYVSAAKRLLYGVIDPGPPAGPSESIVVCDERADPETVAREWLVEAEHGPDSAALLVTHSVPLADRVTEVAGRLLAQLPEQRRRFCESVLTGFGGIVVTSDIDASVDFVNDYAPEHLRVIVESPFELLNRFVNAGEVLLGERTSIAFGNFAIGMNAILPTGGGARSTSCVGVEEFLKRSSFGYVSAQGARTLGPIAVELAEYEGFPGHAEAARHASGHTSR